MDPVTHSNHFFSAAYTPSSLKEKGKGEDSLQPSRHRGNLSLPIGVRCSLVWKMSLDGVLLVSLPTGETGLCTWLGMWRTISFVSPTTQICCKSAQEGDQKGLGRA